MNTEKNPILVRDSYIVEFTINDTVPAEKALYGIVEDDPTGRWRPGDYVCTSAIESINDALVYTHNSVYKTTAEAQKVTLPLELLAMLREGYSPIVVQTAFQQTSVKKRLIEVFEEWAVAADWLNSYNRALGVKPVDLLDNDEGVQAVLDVLTRIEYSVYS